MSQEEQDQILGRLVREKRECEKGIAAVEAKLTSLAQRLSAVVDDLREVTNPSRTLVTAGAALSSAEQMPMPSLIADTLRDLQSQKDKLQQVEAQLQRLNP
jgi:chromosome segregation ATPase